jgi:hypothetical protein
MNMKNELRLVVATALVIGILIGSSITIVIGMPIQSCTPEKAAWLLLQPTNSEIANLKADLVAGDITFEQWKAQIGVIKFRLDLQTVLLKAIRDSPIMSYDSKLEALFAVFPWNIRHSESEIEVITYK